MYTINRSRDPVYPWQLIAPDGAPMAKFALEDDANIVARLLNDYFDKLVKGT